VSDIQMPGTDGFELLREIRALGPDAGGSVPIIAMTAFGTHADRERVLHGGFKGCLLKPFSLLLPTDKVPMYESFECHVADG
jgi:CheY-like chemotaxis protein